MKPKIGRLHVLTDTVLQTKYSHADLAKMAIEGGADTVQLRQKSGTTRDLIKNAELVLQLCRDADVTMIVNDRVDIAFAVDADGVHLGHQDFPIPTARKILGNHKLIGGSATTIEEILEVEKLGADYIGFGPIYPTQSKEDPGEVKGTEYLREVVEKVSIPVIAIGGIKLHNIDEVLNAGAHGVAVISAICCAEDPVKATKEFMKIIRSHQL